MRLIGKNLKGLTSSSTLPRSTAKVDKQKKLVQLGLKNLLIHKDLSYFGGCCVFLMGRGGGKYCVVCLSERD